MNTAKKELASLIVDFSINSIVGFESAFWRMRSTFGIDLLDDKACSGFAITANIQYFNSTYSSLIRRNDAYINLKFDKMKQVMNHRYLCLLTLCFVTCYNIHACVRRKQFNTETKTSYAKSVYYQLNEYRDDITKLVMEKISDTCSEENIEEQDPNHEFIKTFGTEEERDEYIKELTRSTY